MTHFSKALFQEFIIHNHVVGFFENPIKLKSGRHSNWYVNWRNITNDAFLLDQLTDHLIHFLKAEWPQCDTLYGVPEGATKTAILTQFKWAKLHHCKNGSHAIAMGRSRPKEHGSANDKFFIGEPKGNVIVLEDTTTTGGSLIQTVDTLLAAHIHVIAAISLTYRSEKRDDGLSVPEYFVKQYQGKIPFVSLSEGLDLLPDAIAEHLPDLKVIEGIKQEFVEYGTELLEIIG